MPTWAHIDIAGVMESHGELPFLDKGMSGVWQSLDACMHIPLQLTVTCIPFFRETNSDSSQIP